MFRISVFSLLDPLSVQRFIRQRTADCLPWTFKVNACFLSLGEVALISASLTSRRGCDLTAGSVIGEPRRSARGAQSGGLNRSKEAAGGTFSHIVSF